MSQVLEATLPRQPLVLSQLTSERKRLFLQSLRDTGGNVSRSAELAGVSRQNAYSWRDYDKQFALDWDDCLEFGTEHLEESVYKRAMTVSDTLAIFLLKARRPEKYRENIKLDTELSLGSGDIDRLGQSLLAAMTEAAQRMRAAEAQPVAQLGEPDPNS